MIVKPGKEATLNLPCRYRKIESGLKLLGNRFAKNLKPFEMNIYRLPPYLNGIVFLLIAKIIHILLLTLLFLLPYTIKRVF